MTQIKSSTHDNVTAQTFDTARMFEKYQEGMRILLEGAHIQTGLTPKEVIWTKNKAQLYHYIPAREKRFPVPILCVYALINRCYILDLMPSYSLVEYLVSQGFDVYLLDWGTPGEEDQKLTFDHYIFDYLARAVKKMLRHANAEQCSILGYCMGGTMSAMYASLFPNSALRNLILLTTPTDFAPEYTGIYGAWTSEKHFNEDLLVDSFGNIPGELINAGNQMVKPITNYLGAYVTMWNRLFHDRPMNTWLAMNKWVNDGVPFPGEAFRQWIHDFYQQNKLVKGEISLRGQHVDLSRISCSVLNIAGKRDHICTLPQAEATMRLISSQDKEFFTLDAGHVGLLISAETRKLLWPKISTWLQSRSS